ncbi:hypothetical protein CPAR01_06540 [Colletotrichum paranaense]|uniref:Uncharacterized protein n=4 Tax=Colletotrichum acutatum species complex TaxID=2707335 RepID=A0A9Q8SZZ3_9PEZI|nr:uncharacterized protein CLUP02_11211 [Colletotrichum lupini]XP_060315293.1 uncharacterized protein CCOS01_05341 [Colletotrichum costaricense]XP_060349686.1 uncharacterized protein CPAR01_06540 [Colletotrichum paranaense]KAK0377364.1 hypothetical protein CLIM01_05301 [Colletotrichum limetticola]KAK1530238.1 hypothetical protein CCOS01_05341 [Colletotrichum costaricense]KAK1540551.1 hypothetical protein CPAR01_06540 [Colletotrichum paranaense]KAK1716240.1 hypothetical protein BDP67DRAFT_5425
MKCSTIIAASSLALVSAGNCSLPQINLGHFSFPHTNMFVAWSPYTPTTIQELDDVCVKAGAIKGTATWTAVRTASTYTSGPICGNPFNITSDETGVTYRNLELACSDDNSEGLATQVTAIVDATSQTTVQTCTPVLVDGQPFRLGDGCSNYRGSSLSFDFACSS